MTGSLLPCINNMGNFLKLVKGTVLSIYPLKHNAPADGTGACIEYNKDITPP